MGILPNHANFIGRLGMGPAYVRQADKEKVFVVRGGWVHIHNNIVELAADEVIDKELSTEELFVLKEAVNEIPTQTVEGVEQKRREVAWIKHLERFGK